MIQSEIELATFRLVAHYLNQLRDRGPLLLPYNFKVFIHYKSQRYFYKISVHFCPHFCPLLAHSIRLSFTTLVTFG